MTRASLLWAVVIVVILGIGAFLAFGKSAGAPATNNQSANSAASFKPAPTSANANDTSDTALQQDTASIDAQLNGFNSDNANVNGSLNDQPLSQ